MRFEDIILDPGYAYTELMKFLLEVESLEGTVIEKFIKMVAGDKPPELYKPKGGKTQKNYERYS